MVPTSKNMTGERKVMGSIPVGDSDFFFVPRSRHAEYSIFSYEKFFLKRYVSLIQMRSTRTQTKKQFENQSGRFVKCSAPLAICYKHLPRVNKGYLFYFLSFCNNVFSFMGVFSS